MPTKYLLLRADKPLDKGFDLTSSTAWSIGPNAANLSLTTVDGHETDLGALRKDPRNAVVLDADVLLTLVRPRRAAGAIDAAALDARLAPAGIVRMPHGLLAINAHTSPFTGQGVTVAVLDTGLDTAHPAFAGKQLVTRDFTAEGATPHDVTDTDGHGTHCAGTICGVTVDDVRVGVAPGVTKLCIGKVLGAEGGTLEMMLAGMLWAVFDQRAQVVSMSLGYDLPGNTKRLMDRGLDAASATNVVLQQYREISRGVATLRAFLESQQRNVVFVAASGNESRRPQLVLDAGLPAAELLAVGAVGLDQQRWRVADFSNGNAEVVAPGVDVLSAQPGGGWTTMSGTSMATPHVAGVAALWIEKLGTTNGLAAPDSVRNAVRAHTNRQVLVDQDVHAIGSGMIQAPT